MSLASTNNNRPEKKNQKKPAHKLQTLTPKQDKIITTVNNHPELSTYQVAKICDTDHSYVVQIMQRYNITANEVHDYKKNRAEIFAGLQHRLLSSITDEDIKKTPLGSRVLAAAQIYDKERLERDQSTVNVASIHADIADLKRIKSEQNSVIDVTETK